MLDLLGDIGGLSGALYAAFAALTLFFQYKAAVGYVSNHTFVFNNVD